jgi:hypothetical protein
MWKIMKQCTCPIGAGYSHIYRRIYRYNPEIHGDLYLYNIYLNTAFEKRESVMGWTNILHTYCSIYFLGSCLRGAVAYHCPHCSCPNWAKKSASPSQCVSSLPPLHGRLMSIHGEPGPSGPKAQCFLEQAWKPRAVENTILATQ